MEQYSVLDGIFQALADPTRRAVLARLANGPASISELARPFDMALPSFMKHIHFLESSGWIQTRKQGRGDGPASRRRIRHPYQRGGWRFRASYQRLLSRRRRPRTDRLHELTRRWMETG